RRHTRFSRDWSSDVCSSDLWMSVEERRGRILRVAPLSVAGLLRARLFAESTVILTSATLTTGGKFDGLAATWGLPPASSARPDKIGRAACREGGVRAECAGR